MSGQTSEEQRRARHRERQQRYYATHRDDCNKRSLDYYHRHQEKLIEANRKYKKKNKATLKEKQQGYYAKNRQQRCDYSREYRSKNLDVCRKRERETYALAKEKNPTLLREKRLRRYGISLQEYQEILKKQGGACAACGAKPRSKRAARKNLCVDHDHISSKVRGLLCSMCNQALGILNDDPVLLRKLADYLDASA